MSGLKSRFLFYFRTFYKRWQRLFFHFASLFTSTKYQGYFKAESIREWSSDLLCYLMDIVAIPEFYESIFNLFKPNIRPLTELEKAICTKYFGNNIDINLVRIDDKARIGLQKLAIAYVSFNTINYRKKIRTAIFIHELVHVWQYQQFGAVYISKALKAQKSTEGYDYGGVSRLYQMMLSGRKITDFNFEQQADIIEDYYKLHKEDTAFDIRTQAYQYFAEQVKEN